MFVVTKSWCNWYNTVMTIKGKWYRANYITFDKILKTGLHSYRQWLPYSLCISSQQETCKSFVIWDLLLASPWNAFAPLLFHYFSAFSRGSECSYDTASENFNNTKLFKKYEDYSWIKESSIQIFCFGSFSITPH